MFLTVDLKLSVFLSVVMLLLYNAFSERFLLILRYVVCLTTCVNEVSASFINWGTIGFQMMICSDALALQNLFLIYLGKASLIFSFIFGLSLLFWTFYTEVHTKFMERSRVSRTR